MPPKLPTMCIGFHWTVSDLKTRSASRSDSTFRARDRATVKWNQQLNGAGPSSINKNSTNKRRTEPYRYCPMELAVYTCRAACDAAETGLRVFGVERRHGFSNGPNPLRRPRIKNALSVSDCIVFCSRITRRKSSAMGASGLSF